MSIEVRPTYLIMVTEENNNKYYNCFPQSNGTFKVEYGRVNVTKTETEYPMEKWNSQITSKLKKGYKDVTDTRKDLVESIEVVNNTTNEKYKPISIKSVAEIIDKLRGLAKDIISRNYTIKSNNVTQEMVDKAQKIINNLGTIDTTTEFNEKLLELFTVIPRKMDNVKTFLASSTDNFTFIINREQDLIDTMRGQIIKTSNINNTVNDNSGKTILDDIGVTMDECSAEDIKIIKKAMDANGSYSSNKFRRAWKVTNINTQKKFDDFVKKNNIKETKLLFHGSRSENFFSIIKLGLLLRPNARTTGKMFGSGIYFSPKCQKSIGYTSLRGSYWVGGTDSIAYMAIFDTAYGVPYNTDNNNEFYYNYDETDFKRRHPNCNCVHAHAGNYLRNDEIIFYNENQITIKYLIEIGA